MLRILIIVMSLFLFVGCDGANHTSKVIESTPEVKQEVTAKIVTSTEDVDKITYNIQVDNQTDKDIMLSAYGWEIKQNGTNINKNCTFRGGLIDKVVAKTKVDGTIEIAVKDNRDKISIEYNLMDYGDEWSTFIGEMMQGKKPADEYNKKFKPIKIGVGK